jgi:DNA-binding NarL/FixJ family response regulator
MQTTPRLILVDDHLLFRESLKSVITSQGIGCVIGEASNGIEFLKLLTKIKPDLVIIDIEMPGMSGIEATQKAKEMLPQLKFITYTMFGEEDYFHIMVALGVQGFIIKSSGISVLENAIHEVMMGNTYYSPGFREKIIDSFENSSVTCKIGGITRSAQTKYLKH